MRIMAACCILNEKKLEVYHVNHLNERAHCTQHRYVLSSEKIKILFVNMQDSEMDRFSSKRSIYNYSRTIGYDCPSHLQRLIQLTQSRDLRCRCIEQCTAVVVSVLRVGASCEPCVALQ